MCRLFIEADPLLWTSKTRSMRIDGVVTSIRLENFFWVILEEIATRDHMTLTQMVTKLYLESLDADHDQGNFTSFLRVCAGRYLSLMAEQDIPRKLDIPLADLDAETLIASEKKRHEKKGQSKFPPISSAFTH